ncbi:MAG: GGDEF domain-containing protein, partial [Isosphaeraceae bacterium]|nr:GGDEF domain-containing protein [Isosphaeraceae bacterium]
MEEIRATVRALKDHERTWLEQRSERVASHRLYTYTATLILAALNFLFLVLVYRSSIREAVVRQALVQANARLAELATIDPLTGLKNRRAFDEALRSGASLTDRLGLPLSVMMLDVDEFKRFNDTYGHPAGDDVLRAIADLLRANVRAHDVV